MTREIKFRGKSIDSPIEGLWVYGDLLQCNDGDVQIGIHGQYIDDGYHFNSNWDKCVNIDDETVGQFTGLLDKNGKEIWEGDIVRVGILSPNYIGSRPEPYYVDAVCIYKDCAFLYKRISPFDKKKLSRNWTYKPMHRYDIYGTEVIGNIHDNPRTT